MGSGVGGGPDKTRRWEQRTSDLATALLAVGALATSWCSYQSSLWSGQQAAHYSQANGLRVQSTRASGLAGQLALIDIGLFMRWLEAASRGDTKAQRFLQTHFRPEFQAQFAEWRRRTPREQIEAAATPFQLGTYRVALADSAIKFEREAGRLFQQGDTDNENSDKYVFNTVIFAAVLFLTGTSQQLQQLRSRATMLLLATGMLTFALVNVFRLPVQ
jgi:hypothetical protein